MAIAPYRRAKTWSSKQAVERMASKQALFARRREAITSLVESLIEQHGTLSRLLAEAQSDFEKSVSQTLADKLKAVSKRIEDLRAEDALVQNFETELAQAREAETLKALGRKRVNEESHMGDRLADDRSGPRHELGRVANVSSTVRVAGEAGSSGRYDEKLCLFRSSNDEDSGDRRPMTVPRAVPWAADPLMSRLLRIVETPGLAHRLVLDERAQTVTDFTAVDVPPVCEGLPVAPAFANHLFSANALEQLDDRAKRDGFLLGVGVTDPKAL